MMGTRMCNVSKSRGIAIKGSTHLVLPVSALDVVVG